MFITNADKICPSQKAEQGQPSYGVPSFRPTWRQLFSEVHLQLKCGPMLTFALKAHSIKHQASMKRSTFIPIHLWFLKSRTFPVTKLFVEIIFIFFSNCKTVLLELFSKRIVYICDLPEKSAWALSSNSSLGSLDFFEEAPLSEGRHSGRVWAFDTSERRDWQPLVSESASLGRKTLALALLIHPQLLPV